ncbi:MAG: NUDIX hydrolase [Candidatus Paceibacterota bacterium]|jgi:8-oxo-dGTP pyrophosphatase MutT (NUDIX family)
MIYLKKPKKFNSIFEVVSCFFEKDGKILLLHRQDYKPQGNTWGVPAGKVEVNEIPIDAITRELKEEISYKINTDTFKLTKTIYVKYPKYDFIYHIYYLPITKNFEIKIDPKAHKDFKWITPKEALNMNLIQDLDACIKIQYNI